MKKFEIAFVFILILPVAAICLLALFTRGISSQIYNRSVSSMRGELPGLYAILGNYPDAIRLSASSLNTIQRGQACVTILTIWYKDGALDFYDMKGLRVKLIDYFATEEFVYWVNNHEFYQFSPFSETFGIAIAFSNHVEGRFSTSLQVEIQDGKPVVSIDQDFRHIEPQ